jgi:hypothetical protein
MTGNDVTILAPAFSLLLSGYGVSGCVLPCSLSMVFSNEWGQLIMDWKHPKRKPN